MLRNPGTKTAAEVYQLGAKDANSDMLRPVEGHCRGDQQYAGKEGGGQRGEMRSTGCFERKIMLISSCPARRREMAVRYQQTHQSTENRDHPVLAGRDQEGQWQCQWLSFVQELALSEQRLALENTRLPMLKNQGKLAWDAKDKGTFFPDAAGDSQ